MKEKLVAVVLVSFMVASAFGAIGVSATKVDAAGPLTSLSLTYTPFTDLYASQPFTLSGNLGCCPAAPRDIPNVPITLYWKLPYEDDTHYRTMATVKTDANGRFSYATSSVQSIIVLARFQGNSDYEASHSVEVWVTVLQGHGVTSLTLSSSNYYPAPGQQFILSGFLGDRNGQALWGKPIQLWYHYAGETVWKNSGTFYTGTDGKYRITATSARTVYLQAEFPGDSSYAQSSSNVVTINVGSGSGTTTTLTATTNAPKVGQTVTITVNLKSGTAGLSKSVKVWHTTNGVRWEDGTHATANGVYTFTQAFGSTGQRIYHAEFAGDSTYRASSGSVTINVGSGSQTTTTLFASPTSPTIGKSVTFIATLKSGTTLLSGKSVKIYHYWNGQPWTDTTATTNAVGQIIFLQSFGSTGPRTYYATFAGDSVYGFSTSSVVTITVK